MHPTSFGNKSAISNLLINSTIDGLFFLNKIYKIISYKYMIMSPKNLKTFPGYMFKYIVYLAVIE
jgi:hypothetical protein